MRQAPMPDRCVMDRRVRLGAVIAALLVAQLIVGVAGAQSVQPTREELATQTALALDALTLAVDDVSRVTFDVDAALQAAGGTVEDAFTLVRDGTRLVPYRGSLREAVGVLLDGSGNSLDRALLLVALVEASGGTARLAHATLSGDALDRVVTAATGTGPRSLEALLGVGADDRTADAAEVAAEFGLDPGFLAAAAAAAEADAAALTAGMEARVGDQTAFLLQAVPALAAVDSSRTAALSDHWWVQYQAEGGWVDLDPTLPDAEVGETLVEATEFLAVPDLPATSRHGLRLEVVLECSVDGALSEHVLVASDVLSPGDLLGQRVSVQHIPVHLGDGLDDSRDRAAFEESVLALDLWFPVITVGSSSVYDLQFDNDCAVSAATPPWLGTAIVGALDAADDLFGGLFGPPPEDAVTALFLDYHLSVPGEGEVTIRRPLFDALGAAARAAGTGEATSDSQERLGWRLALLGETEVLATPGRLTEPFVTDLLARTLLDQRDAILTLAASSTAAEAEVAVAEAGGVPRQLPSALYGLALARQPDVTGDLYFDGISVLSRHDQVRIGADSVIVRQQAFDIVANPAASLSGSTAAVLAQGVRDTNAETLLSTILCSSALTDEFCVPLGNPADALADTAAASEWLTIADEAALTAASLGWGADALAALRADIAAGYVVVVPASAPAPGVPAAWWRVDPTTGAALGVNELGWGASAAEYGLIVNFISYAFCQIGGLGGVNPVRSTMLCVLGASTGTGALLAAGGVAGALMIASALLYGIGGLGI